MGFREIEFYAYIYRPLPRLFEMKHSMRCIALASNHYFKASRSSDWVVVLRVPSLCHDTMGGADHSVHIWVLPVGCIKPPCCIRHHDTSSLQMQVTAVSMCAAGAKVYSVVWTKRFWRAHALEATPLNFLEYVGGPVTISPTLPTCMCSPSFHKVVRHTLPIVQTRCGLVH